jgi:hypothetical protein
MSKNSALAIAYAVTLPLGAFAIYRGSSWLEAFLLFWIGFLLMLVLRR